MIEFDGHLNGSAEKQFWKNVRKYAYRILLFAFIGMIAFTVFIVLKTKIWFICIIVGIIFLFLLSCLLLLPKEKEAKGILPRRIFTDGEYITCIADKYSDNKTLSDVKQVYDYEEYYHVVMNGGSGFFMYVCQKDLLTQGSLAEFEALFEGKIIDMAKAKGDS